MSWGSGPCNLMYRGHFGLLMQVRWLLMILSLTRWLGHLLHPLHLAAYLCLREPTRPRQLLLRLDGFWCTGSVASCVWGDRSSGTTCWLAYTAINIDDVVLYTRHRLASTQRPWVQMPILRTTVSALVCILPAFHSSFDLSLLSVTLWLLSTFRVDLLSGRFSISRWYRGDFELRLDLLLQIIHGLLTHDRIFINLDQIAQILILVEKLHLLACPWVRAPRLVRRSTRVLILLIWPELLLLVHSLRLHFSERRCLWKSWHLVYLSDSLRGKHPSLILFRYTVSFCLYRVLLLLLMDLDLVEVLLWNHLLLKLMCAHVGRTRAIYKLLADHIWTQARLFETGGLWAARCIESLDEARGGRVVPYCGHMWRVMMSAANSDWLWPCFRLGRSCKVGCSTIDSWWLDTKMLSVKRCWL